MDYVTRIARLIRDRLDPETLPDEPADELLRFYAVLALALGDEVVAPDVHDAWVAWMASRDATHDALIPFDELDGSTAGEDAPFVTAIREVARAEGLGRRAARLPDG